jgi:hypothetical protein
LRLLVDVPWAGRVWALPFLTGWAPAERYHQKRHKRHKTLVDGGRQRLLPLRPWLPEPPVVLVVDSGYAALEFLGCLANRRQPITCIPRLRRDAQLYAPGRPRRKGPIGRPRRKGVRLPRLQQRLRDRKTKWSKVTVPPWDRAGSRPLQSATGSAVGSRVGLPVTPLGWILIRDPPQPFRPPALLSTDLEVAPEQAVPWFVLRWQRATTLAEGRAQLRVESHRPWSELAIARTNAWFVRTVLAGYRMGHRASSAWHKLQARLSAWHRRPQLICSDTIAAVRQQLWTGSLFAWLPPSQNPVETSRLLLQHLTEALCYAA